MSTRVPSGTFTRTHDCGYTNTSRTAGLADRGLTMHSCDKQRELTARAARVSERINSEGEKRDCQHKEANHQHGTRTAYVLDKCRCRPCRNAAAATERTRNRNIAYGRHDTGRVDAAPIRERCFELGRQGIGIKRLAQLTGLSTGTLSKLMYGTPSKNIAPRTRVERRTAEKIMAVRPTLELIAGGHPVPAHGSHRRLQALICLGYSISSLGARLNITGSNMAALMHRDHLTAATARAIHDLYDQLWDKPLDPTDHRTKISVSRARNYARRHGYAPPLAWDDDTIDNPDAQPAGLEPPTRTSVPADQRMEDLEHLLDTGAGHTEILTRLGTTKKTLERSVYRAGRNDLAARLATRTDARRSQAA